MKNVFTKTFSNGLRLLVVPEPMATTVTAQVFVGVGSAFETKRQSGLSHFLEHMCFKGTTRRPSAKVISEELESLGAISNAFTDYEYTSYFAKGNPTHTDRYLDILSDTYLHSTFPDAEIQKEKGVIIEEMNMYEDMPQYKVSDVLLSLMYGDQPFGRSIIGSKESVQALLRPDFLSYKKDFYTAANTVLVLAGKITAHDGVALAKTYFRSLTKGTRAARKKTNGTQRAPRTSVFSKAIDQAHVLIGFRSLPRGHKDMAVARLIATILGRGMSSRLFQLLREELGVAYYVSASQESFLDHGIFSIAAGIDKQRLTEVVGRILEECAWLTTELVSPQELAKAKEFSIGTLTLALERSDDIATFYGTQMVLRQTIKSPDALIREIRRVSAHDIKRVAKVIFQKKKANIALVGPFATRDLPLKLFDRLPL